MTSELADLLPRLERAAAQRQAGRTVIRDDLVQEGLIAAWTALEDGQTVALATWRARQRMGRMLTPERRVKWTGHTTRRSPDSLQHEGLTLSLDSLTSVPVSRDTDGDLDVRAVVARLPLRHKEILFRRFWLEETWAEIGEALGMSLQGVYNIWARSIRPQLRMELSGHSHTETGNVDGQSVVCNLALATGARQCQGDLVPVAPPCQASVAQGAA